MLVKGSFISTLSAGTKPEELTKLSGESKGSKGVQDLKTYLNDEGKEVTSQLLSNSGAGFVGSSLTISEAISLEAEGGKMFMITGR